MAQLSVENAIQSYEGENGAPFHIFEVRQPRSEFTEELAVCAEGIHRVLLRSWTAKFVPKTLTQEDLSAKIPSAIEQAAKIWNAPSSVRYLVAAGGELKESDVQAFIKVREYGPRTPFKQPYPDVTDLETLNGLTEKGPYHRQAAALLLHGLGYWDGDRRVSAYTEAPNDDGVRFYENYGLVVDEKHNPTETIGEHSLAYVHMVGGTGVNVRAVRARIIDAEGFRTG